MSAGTITAEPVVRARVCLLCQAAAGAPCSPKPDGDHLARYLDAYTAGKLTKAYMAMVLGELAVIENCVVIAAPLAVLPGGSR